MRIEEIKARLPMAAVVAHYGWQPDHKNRMRCPFHPDKTASVQLYPETQTAFCFSSNCPAGGKRLDVLDMIGYQENCGLAQAKQKAMSLIPGGDTPLAKPLAKPKPAPPALDRSVLRQLEASFQAALYHSAPAQAYCKSRALNVQALKGYLGFNSGQFHHGKRKGAALIEACVAVGMLQPLARTNNRSGEAVTYRPFAKDCLSFWLRNPAGEPVGFYGRSIREGASAKHFYLPQRQGLYPGYPAAETKTLILTESPLDAATLWQINEVRAGYGVLALFGTQGLGSEHQKAIQELASLEEVVFCLDADQAGQAATQKYAAWLQKSRPEVGLSEVKLPGKDVNEVAQAHEDLGIFTHLLAERQPLGPPPPATVLVPKPSPGPLPPTPKKAEKTKKEGPLPKTKKASSFPPETDFLKDPALFENLNGLMGQSGIIGEEHSRMLLFLIGLSYRNPQPLHAIVQGRSGSGKTHLIGRVADFLPPEDVLRFTRITESSLYNWGKFDLWEKMILIEDLDGLKEDALYAWREFMSNRVLRSSVTIKDKKGNHKSAEKEVRGQFSSFAATTRGETYIDNMNRSFIIALDESPAQTQRIIGYQNQRIAGEVDPNSEEKATAYIRSLVGHLPSYPVRNPYANRLPLPEGVQNQRRLNEMFQSIIKQVTLLHQYQRKRTGGGHYLLTDIQDIELAVEMLFESVLLKMDELDGSSRQFLECLKGHFKERAFNRFEAMEATGFKKSQLQVYLNELVRLEYLKQSGFANRGFRYQVAHWDNPARVRKGLKAHFAGQVGALKKSP